MILDRIKKNRIAFSLYHIRWTLRKLLKFNLINKTKLVSLFKSELVFEDLQIDFQLPEYGDPQSLSQIEYFVSKKFEINAVYYTTLRDVDLLGPVAVFVTNQNQIILTSQLDNLKVFDRCNPKHFNNPSKYLVDLYLEKAICLVNIYNHGTQKNYFHWIQDSISQIVCLKKRENDLSEWKIVIPENCPQPFLDILMYMGVSYNQLIVWKNYSRVKVSELFAFTTIRSETNYTSLLHPFALQHFSYLVQSKIVEPRQDLKIYISRANSRGRKVIEEEKLLHLIESEGFISVQLEKCSFEEQYRLFSRAKIVLASHGAGLTNIVFCKTQTVVIELLSESFTHYTDYFCISTYFDLSYSFVKCASIRNKENPDPDLNDIIIPFDHLTTLIQNKNSKGINK